LKVEKRKSPLPLQRRKNLEGGGKTKKQSPSVIVVKEKEVNSKGSRGWVLRSEFQRK
jgi:hypothetical protein